MVKTGILFLSSIIVLFLVLELIIFNIILLPSDLPRLATKNGGVLKFEPEQGGHYRIKDEIDAEFRINKNGWNSTYTEYVANQKGELNSIAIVGDSYVEALQVDYNKSLATRLKEELRHRIEVVYRFGLSGAPLSHYLYMIEHEVLQFQPDIIIVNLVHNDFHESLTLGSGTYASSLSRLVEHSDGTLSLSEPETYHKKPSWFLKRSNIFRYFWVRQQIRPASLKSIWQKLFEFEDRQIMYAANVKVSATKDQSIPRAVDFIFQRFKQLETNHGLKFILIMDADRGNIVTNVERGSFQKSEVSSLGEIVSTYADKYDLNHYDLTELFEQDYRKNKISLNFHNDGHWNEHAHSLVAKMLAIEFYDLLTVK